MLNRHFFIYLKNIKILKNYNKGGLIQSHKNSIN